MYPTKAAPENKPRPSYLLRKDENHLIVHVMGTHKTQAIKINYFDFSQIKSPAPTVPAILRDGKLGSALAVPLPVSAPPFL